MRSTILATALVLTASAALAQQAPAPTAATHPAWMGPGLVQYLATNPADLNLTRDQQNRIRQAKETLDRAMTPLHERIQAIRTSQVWGNLTVDQRRALADTTRQLAEQVRASHLTALDAVNAALTTEQKTTLEARRQGMHGERMGMRGGRMGMRGGMGGPMDGPMMGPPMSGRGRPMMRAGMRMGYGMGWRQGMRAGVGARQRMAHRPPWME